MIPQFETRFAREPVAIEAPLLVITATDGQSDVEDQAFWLQLSPDASQIEVDGGHDLDMDAPAEVADAVLGVVLAAR